MTIAPATGDARIDLSVDGTPEHRWRHLISTLAPLRWPACKRLVVVAPHPDDETLGSGGLIGTARRRGLSVLVLAVTDGEAGGHAPDLARCRARERAAALRTLVPPAPPTVVRLGVPDGEVTTHAGTVYRRVVELIGPDDLVICPLPDDGHPDHEATARAALAAARQRDAAVRTVPIWAWHWHDPEATPILRGERLTLDPLVRARKQHAIRSFRSQLLGADPVVPPSMVRRLDREVEVLIAPRWSR